MQKVKEAKRARQKCVFGAPFCFRIIHVSKQGMQIPYAS